MLLLVALLCLGLLAAIASVLALRGPEPLPGLESQVTGVIREAPRRPAREPPAATIAPERSEQEGPCWRQFGGGPQRTSARDIELGVPGRPRWARGLGGYIEYPPTYCDGRLYVNTFRGVTYAIEAETGRIVWKRQGASKPSAPALAGDRVIVAANDGTVTAYQRDRGTMLWRLRVGSRVESSPLVVGDDVFFGAADGRLFRADVATGRVRWAFRTSGEINSSPSAVRDLVCITNYAGQIVCLRRTTGALAWVRTVQRDTFRSESFYASASSDGTRLFTIARSGKIVAIAAASGEVLWTQRLRGYGYSTPAVAHGRVYVGGFDGALHTFDAASGRRIWRSVVGGRILGAPVVLGKLVFFATLEQRAYAARISDGHVVWRVRMGKYSPAIATTSTYYMSLNGMLVAYRGSPAG